MPPRKQIEKAAILNQAFEIARKKGFETITARSLAASMNCSTQPIYQAFVDMKALEKEVAEKSFEFMLDQIYDAVDADPLPQDLGFALEYIRFALEETHLFRLIAQNGLFACCEETGDDQVPRMDPKLIIFANGVVFMTAFQPLHWSWEEIRFIVMEAYYDFYKGNNDKSVSLPPSMHTRKEPL